MHRKGTKPHPGPRRALTAAMWACFAIPAGFLFITILGLYPFQWVVLLSGACALVFSMWVLNALYRRLLKAAPRLATLTCGVLFLLTALFFLCFFVLVLTWYPAVAYTTTIDGTRVVVLYSYPGHNPEYYRYINIFWAGGRIYP